MALVVGKPADDRVGPRAVCPFFGVQLSEADIQRLFESSFKLWPARLGLALQTLTDIGTRHTQHPRLLAGFGNWTAPSPQVVGGRGVEILLDRGDDDGKGDIAYSALLNAILSRVYVEISRFAPKALNVKTRGSRLAIRNVFEADADASITVYPSAIPRRNSRFNAFVHQLGFRDDRSDEKEERPRSNGRKKE
ncbi:hypothetical protein NKI25_32895 [Mesorhizobium sp. M0808]|uniref:hypothetical protein n=1 Tax=Mesorhizobium sp. M0808 TaxID=2957002 RepID=UPI00333889F1